MEPIADAADGFDEVARFAELLPQALDVDVDRALENDRVFTDRGVHQLKPRERPAGLAKHHLEQPKLGRRQRQLVVAIKRAVAVAVDDDSLAFDQCDPAAGSSFSCRRRSSFLIRSIRIFTLYGFVT